MRETPLERGFRALLYLSVGVGLVTLLVLTITVIGDGLPFLDWTLISSPTSFNPNIAGARTAILATLWLMGIVIVLAVPIGVGTAVYLEEYADRSRLRNRLIELNIQNLAAVPSIVYGILGLGFIVNGAGLGRITLAGGLILTLLVLPTVIIASREAIRAVPNSIRYGAFALGATQWQMIRTQVLPAATPGIATGSILGLSRAIGESAPLLMLGVILTASKDPDPFSRFIALPVQIYRWTIDPSDKFHGLAAASIVVLLVLLLSMNTVAIIIRNRSHRTS